jgi:CheY-like chemotaxis protein
MTIQSRLILIVDDDYDFLEINRHVLEKAGYRVVTASSPTQALKRVADERPALVITDLMMDDVDAGFSLAAALRDDPATAGVPIILSTSVTTALGLDFRPRSDDDLTKMRVDAYFDKPLPPKDLLAKIDELLAAADAKGDTA